MTATVIRMKPRETMPDISRHLVGRCRQGVGMGILTRISGASAVRAFVRVLARRMPFSDSGGRDDIWQQVEDVLSLVPGLTSNTSELAAFADSVKAALITRATGALAIRVETMLACEVRITAYDHILQLCFTNHEGGREIAFHLFPDGAKRIDDVSSDL